MPPCPSSSRIAALASRRCELFFDLVFVFTITQLTAVLVNRGSVGAIAEVVVMFAVIWWMYDGYAWLTNTIATDRAPRPIASDRRHGGVPRRRARRP